MDGWTHGWTFGLRDLKRCEEVSLERGERIHGIFFSFVGHNFLTNEARSLPVVLNDSPLLVDSESYVFFKNRVRIQRVIMQNVEKVCWETPLPLFLHTT